MVQHNNTEKTIGSLECTAVYEYISFKSTIDLRLHSALDFRESIEYSYLEVSNLINFSNFNVTYYFKTMNIYILIQRKLRIEFYVTKCFDIVLV